MLQRKVMRSNHIKPENIYSELIYDLEWWFHVFNVVYFGKALQCPIITVESARVTNLGSLDITDLGTVININPIHIPYREHWDILTTLLHECIHLWLDCEGTLKATWYHNKAFIEKAELCGLHVGPAGEHLFVTDPFVSLLTRHGVKFGFFKKTDTGTIVPQPDIERPKGKSKLILWSCGCTRVRVAIRYFKAKCLKCGNDFKKVD